MSSLSITPTSPNPADTGPASSKQLHPSTSQIKAEETGEAGPDTTSAPKPPIIETRVGPVSPKVSPRLLARTLGGNRSPAYSANSSPRGASSRSLAAADEFPGLALDRRGSGSFVGGLGTLQLSSTAASSSPGSLSNSSSSGSLLQSPAPSMIRRMSKPLVLTAGSNQALQALLARHTVADIITNRTVVELASTATPAEGFQLLLANSVLSCPVYDAEKFESTGKKSYIGFLDVRDLVSSIVFAHEEQNLSLTSAQAQAQDQWSTHALQHIVQRFGSAVSVTYLSRRNPFRPISSNATLLQVAKLLSTQLHRLPVVDAEGRCTSIISQSSIVQFLNAHKDEVKQDLNQTISSLSLGLCKVISVASDASAWSAFKALEVNNVSGIAIVDRDGKLVANTSARDLKFFLRGDRSLSLDSPITLYLAKIRQREFTDEVHPSSSVGLNTTVAHCIGLLAATGYHRVFIVDSNSRPIGVVSVTDVLRFAAAETAGTAGATSQSPSNPTTPRGGKRLEGSTGSVSSSSLLSASSSVSPPSAVVPSPQNKHSHLRTHSNTNTPLVTPHVPPQ